MSRPQVINGDPCATAARPPINTNSTLCRSSARRIASTSSGGSASTRFGDKARQLLNVADASLGRHRQRPVYERVVVGVVRHDVQLEIEVADPEQSLQRLERGELP